MKKNKKKGLVLALLLFAAIGFAGFGAYSYYYTEGNFQNDTASYEEDDNVVRITESFNPIAETTGGPSGSSGSSSFLGNGGTMALDCPETTGGHETITCTGTLTVKNEGSTTIRVSYQNGSSSASSSDATVSADDPDFYWGSYDDGYSYTTISAGSSETLHVSVDVNVGDTSSISGSDAQIVYAPVESGTLTAYVNFGLTATQISY